MIFSLVLFFFILAYAYFILRLAFGIGKIPYFTAQYQSPETTFSIVVPFRNETKALPELLLSLSQLKYPNHLFEIILVDDDSEDGFKIETNFDNISILTNIRKSNSPKKDAIETAIGQAKYSWIITTDADCLVPQNWLKTLDAFIRENEVEMVVGAVIYQTNDDFVQHFQQLELMSLQGVTIGSFGISKPFMCNGANFAYTKNLFQTLNGFADSNHIASGDDVFLLQKTIHSAEFGVSKIGYLKNHDFLVLTQPCFSWSALLHQRIRWASKAPAYKNIFAKVLALCVFFGNLSVVLGLVFCLFGLIPFWDWYLLFGIKIIADFILQYKTGKYIQPRQIRYYLFSTLWYPFFSVGVALLSMKGNYEWKGRSLS
jgi:glycosyltransferase involved in cell wall biosynthesis